ncbi:SagF family protein [Clostridium botulinum]|nr:SagF family protein [Clostridium botulinum]
MGILEISFFMIIVVVSYLMKKDSRKQMSNVSWIKFNKKYPFYTGMLKPIIYTVLKYYFITM